MESRTTLIERVSSQFEDLARAIHELVVPIDGDALVDVRGLLDALTARVALAEAALFRLACTNLMAPDQWPPGCVIEAD